MRIALISCTKKKQNKECMAQDLYVESALFKKAREYIKYQNYDSWYILSALYGLLEPEQLVSPYNQTLNGMPVSEIRAWSAQVAQQLVALNLNTVDFYAGKNYRKELIPLLEKEGITCNVPLLGKGIGEQLSFYTIELKKYNRTL